MSQIIGEAASPNRRCSQRDLDILRSRRSEARHRRSTKSCVSAGMTLAELLVVLAIIVTVAGAVTFAVANALKKQQAKACLTNMLMIEAAKDEYGRDHPGATVVGDDAEFRKYFRFGVPRCPVNPKEDYENWNALGTRVFCKVHGAVETIQAIP
jgi:prepilin-type N-terminal cleavage/methylation domain-containing protein